MAIVGESRDYAYFFRAGSDRTPFFLSKVGQIYVRAESIDLLPHFSGKRDVFFICSDLIAFFPPPFPDRFLAFLDSGNEFSFLIS